MSGLTDEDRIIVVMGVTGSGKSTFIEKATQQDGRTVGHKLKSFTSEVRAVRVTYDQVSIVFVDTPGFDDTRMSDTEILGVIAEWLQSAYKSGKKLTGLLYLHRITDNRMYGSAVRNLDVFEQLCGDKTMSRVIFVTTMWNQVSREVGEEREKELINDYWNSMLIAGSCTQRFEKTFKSAWEIVHRLPAFHQSTPPSLVDAIQIQDEMVLKRYKLEETLAAKTLHTALEKLLKDKKAASKRLQEQAGRQGNEVLVQQLNERKQETDANIQEILAQMKQLNLTVPKRLMRLLRLF